LKPAKTSAANTYPAHYNSPTDEFSGEDFSGSSRTDLNRKRQQDGSGQSGASQVRRKPGPA
jgi:hypothetical protein